LFLFCDLLDRFAAEQKAKALSTPSLFAIAVTVSFLSWKHEIGYGCFGFGTAVVKYYYYHVSDLLCLPPDVFFFPLTLNLLLDHT
jgi:hypothetical protein